MSLAVAAASVTPITAQVTPGSGIDGAGEPRPVAPAPRVPVLVELFTSQGCSSCPPADAFLEQLERVQPIRQATVIALAEHVDYWDSLGWSDLHGDPAFTRRQYGYAERLDLSGVYTPQMIVDGERDLIGGDRGAALRAVLGAARRPKARVALDRRGAPGRLHVVVDELPDDAGDDAWDVMLAIAENGIVDEIARGENAGRTLRHDAVAHGLRRIGGIDDGPSFDATVDLDLPDGVPAERLEAVVFVQRRPLGRVIGVASLPLAAPAPRGPAGSRPIQRPSSSPR